MDTNLFVEKLFSSLGEWFPDVSAEFVASQSAATSKTSVVAEAVKVEHVHV